jgi:hypothetical protein
VTSDLFQVPSDQFLITPDQLPHDQSPELVTKPTQTGHGLVTKATRPEISIAVVEFWAKKYVANLNSPFATFS